MHHLDSIVEVKKSKFGKGLFAKRNICRGATILNININKEELNFEDTLNLNERESHSLQIGIDQYILCETPFLFTNHSCNPNSGINQFFELIALRNIAAGEEIFWDYSTSMLERHWQMECGCGEEKCRHLVTDFDLLPNAVQTQYVQLNIVLPFILRIIFPLLAKTA